MKHILSRLMLWLALVSCGLAAPLAAQNTTTLTSELDRRGVKPLTAANIDAAGGDPTARAAIQTKVPMVNGKVSIAATRLSIPKGLAARTVMAAPPTVTVSTTSQITSPRFVPAVTAVNRGDGVYNSGIAGSDFSFLGASNFKVVGNTFPAALAMAPETVRYNDGQNTMNWWKVASIVRASKVEFVLFGQSQGASYGTKVLFRIDDQYVSLEPTQVGATGLQYVTLDFGTVATRRVEILGKLRFAGVNIGQTDTIFPAPVRGPRAIVVGDSWTEGTGATSTGTGPAYLLGYVQGFADALQWDDVWPSGVGGSGYLNTGKPTYRQRLATDVIPFAPEVLAFAGGTNDYPFTYAQIYAEALLTYQTAKAALPKTTIIVISPFAGGGAGKNSLWNIYHAVKAAARDAGVIFVDVQSMPLPPGTVPDTITLAASVGSGTELRFTELPVNGATYEQVGTYKRFQIRDVVTPGQSPYRATVDATVVSYLNSGTQFVRVGNGWLTGGGTTSAPTGWGNADLFVDNTAHLTTAGHDALGQAVASALIAAFAPQVSALDFPLPANDNAPVRRAA